MRSVLVGLAMLSAGALVPIAAQAQEASVRGAATDARTGAPLAGVQVYFPSLGIGSLSDEAGQYILPVVAAGEYELRAQMLGRATEVRTVSVTTGSVLTINFVLETSAIGLDEIVVTGTPGAQLRRSLGNVVGRIDAAEIQEKFRASTLEELLVGSGTPGLTVDLGSNAKVASGGNIRIRGIGSMALSSQPLLYVDGVRVNNSFPTRNSAITGHFPPSRWQDLNPEDIESIEVIKGPAAATLYGTEASNGVVNIITKKGRLGAPRLSIRLGGGANWLSDPETAWNETAYRCRGISTECTTGEVVRFNVLREDRIRNGDTWFRTGLPRAIGASVEGGSDNFRYFTSVDFDRNEGMTVADWRQKLSGRANLTWTPTDNLDLQFGMGTIRSDARIDSFSGIIGIQWACTAPGCEAGAGANAVDGYFRGYFARLPMMYMNHDFQLEALDRTNYNFTITHRPTSWLTHRLVTGSDYTLIESSRRQDQGLRGGIDFLGGRKIIINEDTDFLTVDYSATAAFDVTSDLNLSTSGGVQFNKKTFHTVQARGSTFPVPQLKTISAGAQLHASENYFENKTLGAYVQEQISWKNRFFLTAAMRGDDNSAFGENFDFVVYPKLSTSWVISEQPFMAGAVGGFLSQLRLRAAWGKAGQQPDVLAAVRTYGPVPGPAGTTGLSPSNLGNVDVKPEVGEELELGFDASFWDDHLSLEMTYYDQTRRDALVSVPAAQSYGFPGAQFRNLGEVKNSGIEIGLRASDLYSGGSFGLEDVFLMVATNKNRVTDLGGLAPQIMRGGFAHSGWTQQLYAEGYPAGAMFMKRVVSADITGTGADALAANVMCEGGTELFSDLLPNFNVSNGGGGPVPCANAPNVYIGGTVPTIEVSFGTTITLGDNLRLFGQVDYVDGHTMIDGPVAGNHLFYRNSPAIVERTDPILLGYESLSTAGLNQVGLFDAGFIRLRRVSLTFDFPETLSEQFGARTMSLSVSASNPWLIWTAQQEIHGNRIVDPEASYTYAAGTDPGGLSAYVQNQAPAMNAIMLMLRVGL